MFKLKLEHITNLLQLFALMFQSKISTMTIRLHLTGGPTASAFVDEIEKCKTEKPFSYFVVKTLFCAIFSILTNISRETLCWRKKQSCSARQDASIALSTSQFSTKHIFIFKMIKIFILILLKMGK
jgi:hypothetical protein